MDGCRKEDPLTNKKLPVGIDIPEFLAELGIDKAATELVKAVGNFTVIAFYYFLRVVEYTIKVRENNTKQTVQFKLEYTFFSASTSKGT